MTNPASVTVENLSIRFPIYGVDQRSLKKHLARIAIGGRLGTKAGSSSPVLAALKNQTVDFAGATGAE